MSEDAQRPGGLLAMAIINFVLGGLGIFGAAANFVVLQLWDTLDWDSEEVLKVMKEEFDKVGFGPSPEFYASIIAGAVAWTIAIFAGIGYLKMKRRQGRYLGNLFAILALVAAYLEVTAMSFGMLSFLSFLYPVLTLVLLNTTFKEDLVR